jgi:predicted  nucleic acid-binding Zn-ribbon protein
MIHEELQKLENLPIQVSKKLEAVTAENEQLKAQIEQMTQEFRKNSRKSIILKIRLKLVTLWTTDR